MCLNLQEQDVRPLDIADVLNSKLTVTSSVTVKPKESTVQMNIKRVARLFAGEEPNVSPMHDSKYHYIKNAYDNMLITNGLKPTVSDYPLINVQIDNLIMNTFNAIECAIMTDTLSIGGHQYSIHVFLPVIQPLCYMPAVFLSNCNAGETFTFKMNGFIKEIQDVSTFKSMYQYYMFQDIRYNVTVNFILTADRASWRNLSDYRLQ